MNQPITFRSTVSSSGYTKAPTSTSLFKLPSIHKSSKKTSSKPKSPSLESIWWSDHDFNNGLEYEHIYMMREGGATTCVKFDHTGNYFATASVDRIARVYKGKGESHSVFAGHDTTVASLAWGSVNTKRLLTCSLSGHGFLWSLGNTDPILTFGPKRKANGSGTQSPSNIGNELYEKVSGLQFFYKDQFILLSSGKSLNVVKYNTPTIDPKSVEPGINRASAK
ncbi:Signal-induced proliferation-associated 1-like protein 2, partial [Chytridiales sp. JEL 0842]